MATAHQQFSLKWNNYSQHIVTALEELRVDDELTDVTLSSDGQRIKAHKVLLSACSVFFKETFKENPCKHPVVILKGVTFQDLQAVVQFMYNGQVNVSQERLPSFLQTAEILQIKGLTDSASDKEETSIPAPAKKRPQTFPQTSTTQQVDSVGQDADRPPTPKRKRVIGSASGTLASAQNSELSGTASVISASGAGASNANNNGHQQNSNQSSLPPPLHALNSDNSGDGLPLKYEDQEELDEEFDRNDDSFQDKDKDVIERESDLSNSLGSGKIRTSANGNGDRRPRYNMQPSSNDLLSATGVVDATNATLSQRMNGVTSSPRDLIFDGRQGSYVSMNGTAATNGNGLVMGPSKLRSRLSSRSLSSGGTQYNNHHHPQQEDRVIKYAPLQSLNGRHSHSQGQDSRSNSPYQNVATFVEDGSDSVQGTDEDDEHYQQRYHQQHQYQQQQHRRPFYSQQAMQLQQPKTNRALPQLLKTTNSSQPFMVRNSVVNGHMKGASNNIIPNDSSTPTVEDLSVSSPAHQHAPSDLSTPSFSLTQQLLQQNVLSLISQNGAEVIKNGISPASRASTVAASSQSSSSSSTSSATNGNSNSNGMVMGESPGEQSIMAPYVCDVCGKRYVHHRSLNDHKKSHTGATRCPVCNKSFSKVANMRAHYTAQHGSGSQNNDSSSNSSSNGGLPNHIDESGNNLHDNQLSGRIPLNSSA